ncbi:tyrosine-type recombinase/integrase [Acidilobus sp. 7A]|uniref:tyrosine-type recombinase/integrase n=1 Tax=Acidilobus sp. 7A TaxID=1577685 RepID=UPI000E3B5CAE|nr:tyrosine-type recombinase/integrase [Acidilobus sp. 7A]
MAPTPGSEACVRRGWGSCVEYRRAYAEILAHLYKTGSPWDVVLLVQLRNGSRIGEAIEVVKEFCNAKGRADSVRVRVEKHAKGDTRLMVLSEELRGAQGRDYLRQACLRLSRVKAPRVDIADYCRRAYGFNTHALRYAFITYMLKRGVSPSIVAKITGHRSLNHILHYTEVRLAEEVLAGLRGWGALPVEGQGAP